MISLSATHYAVFLLIGEILFCILLFRSKRLRAWADVICCAFLGAFIHLLLLQVANVRTEEWEILSASILVLGFSFMGWSVSRMGAMPDHQQSPSRHLGFEASEELMLHKHSLHDERLRTMGALSARYVHEVSQPLSIMMLRLEDMKKARKKLDDESIDKAILKIEAQLLHVLKLSKALKNFASTDAQIQPGFVRLGEIFNLTRELFEAWRLEDGLEFHWPNDIPNVEVSGGSTLHVQVLINLLKNAVDAVSELSGESARWVRVEIIERGGDVEIAVANSGRPIHRNVQSRLFKPFFSTKRMGQGLGLGLSICQQLVHSLGGEIWYDARSSYPRFVVRYAFLPSVQDLNDGSVSEPRRQALGQIA